MRQEVGGLQGNDKQNMGCFPDEVLDGITEPKKKKTPINFFQELLNKIKREWRTPTNKESSCP